MSDHLDADGMQSPNMDARVDITDVYAFQKPGDANKTIFVFNVNPVAPTLADAFADEAVYELKIDSNGDAVADLAYRFTFSPKQNGAQSATVRQCSGAQASGSGNDGDILFQDVPVAFDNNLHVVDNGNYRFFAGIRSDPFFFDLDGMHNNMQFTGKDTFIDKNVFSMILEVANSDLGSNPQLGIWGRVLVPKDGNPFFQIDRMARPLVNVAFTPEGDKNTFNQNEPTRDRELFAQKFANVLAAFGRDASDAQQTASSLLPDILDYNYTSDAGYRNGRNLTDDIIDMQLTLLTNGKVTTDKVGPHTDLLTSFPYLGHAHLTT